MTKSIQHVYLIKCLDKYKIGIANDVKRRLAELSTGNPFPLELVAVGPNGGRFTESLLHDRFAHRRVAGEWFELDTAEVAYVTGMFEPTADALSAFTTQEGDPHD